MVSRTAVNVPRTAWIALLGYTCIRKIEGGMSSSVPKCAVTRRLHVFDHAPMRICLALVREQEPKATQRAASARPPAFNAHQTGALGAEAPLGNTRMSTAPPPGKCTRSSPGDSAGPQRHPEGPPVHDHQDLRTRANLGPDDALAGGHHPRASCAHGAGKR